MNHEVEEPRHRPETLLPCASPRDLLAAEFKRQELRDLPRANTPAVLPGQQMNMRARRRSAPLQSFGEADDFAGFEPPAQHRMVLPPSDRRRPRRNTDDDVLARTNGLEPGFSGASGFSGAGDPLSATAGPWRPVAPWEDGSVVVSSKPQPKRTRRGTKDLGPLEEAENSAFELPFSWRGGGGGSGGGGGLLVPSLCECPGVSRSLSRSLSNSSSTMATGGVGGGSGSNASSLAVSPRAKPSPRRRPSMGGAGGLLDPLSTPVVPAATDACAAAPGRPRFAHPTSRSVSAKPHEPEPVTPCVCCRYRTSTSALSEPTGALSAPPLRRAPVAGRRANA